MEISVVIPCFNEQGNVRTVYERLTSILDSAATTFELVFVDDGSSDGTLVALKKLAASDPRVKFRSFSRNFGHEAATTAGLERAIGRAVVIIDADLQDPPELIPEMLDAWRNGSHVVYAQRRIRQGEKPVKKLTAWAFYRIMEALAEIPIPRDTGDFRLMDRAVVRAVLRCKENPRFVRGLVAWAGFKQTSILYDREPRHSGETKYNISKLTRLALDAIFGFSLTPLRILLWTGLSLLFVGAAILSTLIVVNLLADNAPFGDLAILLSASVFLNGFQLTALGVVSYYLGNMFKQTQARPMFIIAEEETGFVDHINETQSNSIASQMESKISFDI
jgi:dolichol-phosphate mannosyltransferase